MLPSQGQIRTLLKPYGVRVSSEQATAIRQYIELLLLWNHKLSLTAVRHPEEIVGRHFGESMFAAHIVPIRQGRLADVGSGAGFPGLALKIAVPDLQVRLIEANAKKAAFLAEICRKLSLDRVEIVRERYENLPPSQINADFIAARAIGHFRKLLTWDALLSSGTLILWIGSDDARIVAATRGWLWREPVSIPNSLRRVLLVGARQQE